MINLEINARKIQVEKGTSIIEAADNAGIYIPRFCYHKNLSVAASCRMCLVEVDGVGKTLPACATVVSEGMKISTKSEKVANSQKAIMEFLLINHPLDCPICDQGGECDLQDIAVGYGITKSAFYQSKRSVSSTDISPLIETEMTRCILCTRCVRFGEEISGIRELGVVNRGESSEIGAYVQHMLHSELSGNVIDICPVGALTAKPSRYSVRSWELSEIPSIGYHDCVGSNTFVHVKKTTSSNKSDLVRVVPRENNLVNETWISDRDRFSYEGLSHEERCLNPVIKTSKGRWKEVTWDDALKLTATITKRIQSKNPNEIGFLLSSNITLEECYLVQKFARKIGTNNIDHRIRQTDFTDQENMSFILDNGIKIRDIENLDTILLIGSNVRLEQPIVSYNIRKAFLKKARIIAINPSDYSFDFSCEEVIKVKDPVYTLSRIFKGLTSISESELLPTKIRKIVNILKSGKKSGIFLGSLSINSNNYSLIRHLCLRIKNIIPEMYITLLMEGANPNGAYFAGGVPEHAESYLKVNEQNPGKNYKEMIDSNSIKLYYTLNFEPEYDTSYMSHTLKALKKSEFTVCMTPFVTKTMKKYADIILPISPFSENEGTLVNFENTWQTFSISCQPRGKCKPAWQVLRALSRLMNIRGLEYRNVQEVHHTLLKKSKLKEFLLENNDKISEKVLENKIALNKENFKNKLIRIGSYPVYCTDNVVRRAQSLQKSMTPEVNCIMINNNTANRLNLISGEKIAAIQGKSIVILPLSLDGRLANNVVVIPTGILGTSGFGISMAEVKLKRTTRGK